MSVKRSSLRFAAGTLLSRGSGLLRDMVVVGTFGASSMLDAFLIAFRIPNLLRDMLAEGALGSAFTKVYAASWEEDPQKAALLLVQTIRLVFLAGVLVTGLGILLAPELVDLMTVFAEDALAVKVPATSLTRILFVYLMLSALGSVIMGALHQHGKFFLTAVSPAAENLGYIAGTLWLSMVIPEGLIPASLNHEVMGLAIGVIAGALLHHMINLWGLVGLSSASLSGVPLYNKEVGRVLKIMGPAAIAASAGPINLMINTNFAASVGPGAVSWLNYAFRLLQLPVGLFAVAVGVSVLPVLSRALQRSGGRVTDEASGHLSDALAFVLWLTIPAFAFLCACSEPVVTLIFQHGRFGEADTLATSQALFAYSFALMSYPAIKVLTQFYYATERTAFAMKVSLVGIFVNLIGNYLLVARFGHVGLAWTTVLTLGGNALILAFGAHHFGARFGSTRFIRLGLLLGGLTLVSIVLQRLCLGFLDGLEWELPTKGVALVKVTGGGAIVTTVFFLAYLWSEQVSLGQIIGRLTGRKRP